MRGKRHERSPYCTQLSRSVVTAARTNTRKNEKSFSTVGRRPGRPSPTVPPRPLPWLPMAMADLRHASRVVWHRARAQGSQPPSPVDVVGWRKLLRLLFVRPQLFLAMPTLLWAAGRTLPQVVRAPSTSYLQGQAQTTAVPSDDVASDASRHL